MKGFCPLASGSKGNCLYLGTEKTKLLIDAGISGRAIKERLSEIDVAIEDIDAILISHEHTDHIRGVDLLAKKYNIPVLTNAETAKALHSLLKTEPKFKIFSTGETFEFGGLEIHPFSVQHDTLDPVAFTIQIGDFKVGICTDLGFVTTLVKAHLRECDILYIESNHEPSMVHASPRPMVYKQRVLGRQGHISNEMCAKLISEIYHEDLQRVYLAHLSGECNNPDLALKRVQDEVQNKLQSLCIAYQDQISEPFFF